MSEKVRIHQLATGVPGLDNLLGGGFPQYSFNLIAGPPGSGKTTLANQIMFALASPTQRALFFTVLGEPTFKMLRYQQQFGFFDTQKINDSIRFINLSDDLLKGNFQDVLKHIVQTVREISPALVFVESFRSIAQTMRQQGGIELQHFVQQLVVQMSSWQATTFLIGEYSEPDTELGPIFTVADSILLLSQNLFRNSMVRKIQVVKVRGQAHAPGLHTFRMSDQGIRIFPRAVVKVSTPIAPTTVAPQGERRKPMGIAGLDEMLGGGLPAGYSLLVVGPSGAGKTILATEFLAEGVRLGEPGVIAAFEKSPSQLLGNKRLLPLIQSGQVGVIDTRSLDLSIDETLHDLIEMIDRMQAKRVVIDSLSGFELALAPEFSEDFRGSLYRMVAELTAMGVTILMTSELEDRYTELRFSPFGSAFLADAIIVQRYVEMAGQFRRAISVIKVRGSAHCKDIRLFDIQDEGIVLGETLSGYDGITTGQPTLGPKLPAPSLTVQS
jgi:circadian clock protein KaiC